MGGEARRVTFVRFSVFMAASESRSFEAGTNRNQATHRDAEWWNTPCNARCVRARVGAINLVPYCICEEPLLDPTDASSELAPRAF